MKVLIGITQDLEQTRNFLKKEFKETGIYTETGPFESRKGAAHWEHFMTDRASAFELLALPSEPTGDDLWYGVTLEWGEK